MKLLVCGSRDFKDQSIVDAVMKGVYIRNLEQLMASRTNVTGPMLTVIEGAALGADELAGRWAKSMGPERGVQLLEFPAKWEEHGKAAGPIRNAQMLVEGDPDLVLAFHERELFTDNTRGTSDMVKRAVKASVPTYAVRRLA